MNTRQKLTLGIAAIFMVTLTIVGVTYAYFVTRVTGDLTEQTVDVTTATIGEVRYEDEGSDVVEFTNVLPGVSKYKVFSVINDSTDVGNIGVYNIFLTNTVGTANEPEYIHAIDDSGCYVSTVQPTSTGTWDAETSTTVFTPNASKTATCFDGTEYNNIYVTLYEVADYSGKITDGENEISETVFGQLTGPTGSGTPTVIGTENTKLSTSTNVLATNQQVLGGAVGAANKVRYYVLKVEYRDTKSNQNLENQAVVNIKVSIN